MARKTQRATHLRAVDDGEQPLRQSATSTGPQPSGPELEPLDLASAFRRYSAYVAAIGMKLLGRQDDVDDLVQDVFLEAHKGLTKLKDPGAIKAWLATIAVRRSYSVLRRRKFRSMFSSHDFDYSNIAGSGASPEQAALLAQIYKSLDQLPAKQRVPWTLRYIQGESLDTIALVCGCSLTTVKRRISAAHLALKGVIGRG